MQKEVNINLDTSIDILKETIEGFKNPNAIRYDENENKALLNICRQNIDSSNKDIAKDLRSLKKAIMMNKMVQVVAKEYYKLDKPYQEGHRVMSFEKKEFKRLKDQLKSSDVNTKNGAYYYCIYLGLVKSHLNTSGFIADEKEKVASIGDFYGYIPSEKFELVSDEFQKTITDALDNLEQEINIKRCK